MSPDLLVAGLATGAAYGLVALGIVLVYKGTRVINFAQGEFGTVCLYLAWQAVEGWGWPYPAGAAFALAGVALLGLATERIVVRPLLDAPRITMLVATVGLAIAFGTAETQIWGPNPQILRAPVRGLGVRIGDVLLTPTRMLTVGAAIGIGVALYLFLKRTTFGLGVLAASEDPSGVPLTGLSLGRVSGFTWASAAVVAGVGGLLLAPSVGTFHPLFMTVGLSKALAAALVGGLTSLPGAFAGGLLVGVTESVLLDAFPLKASLVDAGVFALILAVLLVRPQGIFGTASAAPSGSFGRQGVTAGRRLAPRGSALVALAVLCAVVPLLSDYRAFVLGWMLAAAIVGVGLNLVAGYAGQASLGHAAFLGFGAATAAWFAANHGYLFWGAVPMAAAAGALAGAVVGLPSLRIRGMELAVSTLAFAVVFERVLLPEVLGGRAGLEAIRPERFSSNRAYAYLAIAALVIAWWVDRNYVSSRPGRAAAALRDDERVAASVGIAVGRAKLTAFVLSGAIAGLAGGVFAFLLQSVSTAGFPFALSLTFMAAVVVGGLRSRPGAAVGAALIVAVPQVFESLRLWGQLLGAGLVVVTVIRSPGGIAQVVHDIAERLGAARLPFARPGARPDPAGLPRTDLLEMGGRSASLRRPPIPPNPYRANLASGRSLPNRATPARRPGPVLSVQNLSKRYGGLQVLDDVSLEVRENEISGLIGPNGAGKTTLFDCISGFVRPDSGRIAFQGSDISALPAHRRAALGIARTFQLVGLAKSETVLTNLLIAQHLLLRYADAEALAGAPVVRREDRRAERRARAVLGDLGLSSHAGDIAGSLPHGTMKLVEVACALASGPQLLLLDEPSSGMAPAEAMELGHRLRDVRDRFDVTVLMVEHHVPLVLETCDWVYAVDFGRQVTDGPPRDVARHQEVVEAYLGPAEPKKRRRRARSA